MLSSLLTITILSFAVASMLSVGCSYTLRQIMVPLRSLNVIARAVIANFVLVPLYAFGILHLIPLDRPLAIGLKLLALAAGAPFLVKLILAVEGDIGLSATLLVLLLPVSIVYMPLVVPALSPHATVSRMSIAAPLFLSMLLPLGIGLFFSAKRPRVAARLRATMRVISSVALIVLFALTVLLNFREIMGLFGTGAIFAATLLVAGAFVIGYTFGSNRDRRLVLGFGTAQRNIAAAMVVATKSFRDPDILVMVVLGFVVTMLLLFPAAWVLRQLRAKRGGQIRRAA
jgi:BASS family bile acid:Na+ symporter